MEFPGKPFKDIHIRFLQTHAMQNLLLVVSSYIVYDIFETDIYNIHSYLLPMDQRQPACICICVHICTFVFVAKMDQQHPSVSPLG